MFPVGPDYGVGARHVVDKAGDVKLAVRLDVEMFVPQDLDTESQNCQPQHSTFLQDQTKTNTNTKTSPF